MLARISGAMIIFSEPMNTVLPKKSSHQTSVSYQPASCSPE